MREPAEKFRQIRDSIPEEVDLVVASKGRSPEEVEEVIGAGAKFIGENYTSPEAVEKYQELGEIREKVSWELIGHLQKNDINKALPIFDRVQTVESVSKAKHIDKRVEKAGKEVVPVLIEVNSGNEENKYGIEPTEEALKKTIDGIGELSHLRLEGLMTMGPYEGNPEDARPYFEVTRKLFEVGEKYVKEKDRMEVLSMGMSNSYRVAIEEGANMVRIGTKIFGPR
ncbi:YggS family pyridoxal phosphate-dependent enzyme [Candidatus Bipolaricaulota bacterium]|nr:YggS family pyridoxal phosphate-dependent enzyme [Candidatus Bipolaricaulota bacterium]MBS3825425.1 YggS family pyridoxal phosphate-dependent enzyme [Candidatus Bipolaricaulota bacterium]